MPRIVTVCDLSAGVLKVADSLQKDSKIKFLFETTSQPATKISDTADVYFSNGTPWCREAERRVSSQGTESFKSLPHQTHDTAVAHTCRINHLRGENVVFFDRN